MVGKLLVILTFTGFPVESISKVVSCKLKLGIIMYLDLDATQLPATTSAVGVIAIAAALVVISSQTP
jgi:hypothetical protein